MAPKNGRSVLRWQRAMVIITGGPPPPNGLLELPQTCSSVLLLWSAVHPLRLLVADWNPPSSHFPLSLPSLFSAAIAMLTVNIWLYSVIVLTRRALPLAHTFVRACCVYAV